MNKSKKISASFYFKYPQLATVRNMAPAERVSAIDKKFQDYLKRVKKKLAGYPFEPIGTKKRPQGIKIEANQQILNTISELSFVNTPIVDNKATKKAKSVKHEYYFCIKMIVQIQIEGHTTGMQLYEERFVLIKADDRPQAEKKVLKEMRGHGTPYLNSSGELVRWKFESIEDIYEVDLDRKNDFTEPVEVFSKFKRRKLDTKNIWNGQ